MSGACLVRRAEAADFDTIAAITNDSIASEPAHFGFDGEPASAYRAAWERDATRHSWFVACVGDGVVGYAKSYDWKTRGAYRWMCEVGVYVAPLAHGRGVGKALYAALFDDLAVRGFRRAIAGITLPNDASVRLHEAMGMTRVGVIPGAGYKLGAWRDVGYWAGPVGLGSEGPPDSDRPAPFVM